MIRSYLDIRWKLRQCAKSVRESGINSLKTHNFKDILFYEDFSLIFKFITCFILFLVSLLKSVSLTKMLNALGLAKQGVKITALISDEAVDYYFGIPLLAIFIISFIIMYAVMHVRLKQAGTSKARNIVSLSFLAIAAIIYFFLKPEKITVHDPLLVEIMESGYVPKIALGLSLFFLFFSVIILISNKENKTYL
jgi:hypothetical protein